MNKLSIRLVVLHLYIFIIHIISISECNAMNKKHLASVNIIESSVLNARIGDIKLTNGEYKTGGAYYLSSKHDNYAHVWIDKNVSNKYQIVYSDLNNDNLTDAVAVICYHHGGNAILIDIGYFQNKNGHTELKDSIELGKTTVKRISINNNIIEIQTIEHDLNDPQCCPSIKKTRLFKIENDKIKEQKKVTLSTKGFGEILFGNNVSVIENCIGEEAIKRDDIPYHEKCAYIEFGKYPGISFMIADGIIVLLDSGYNDFKGGKISPLIMNTSKGEVQVGMTVVSLKKIYPNIAIRYGYNESAGLKMREYYI